MPPIRLLLVYYEPFTSGQTAHVLSLARGLDKTRYQIHVILPDLLRDVVPQFEAAGARVTALPLRRLAWQPAAIAGLMRIIRAAKPDIVHIHSQEAGLVARPLAWLAGARQIFYTPQTIDIRRKRWQELVNKTEGLLAHFTAQILSVNEADRQRMAHWGIPLEKISTLYNGVDLDEVTADPGLSQLAFPENPVVLQLGRLSEQKNPLAFVEGARLVLQSLPQARFIMIGDGPLRPVVEESIQAKCLDGKIILMGTVPQAAHYLGQADVITLTSNWEGTPYSLIEAMAWRKPVVATSVNGCPEVVEDHQTGFLVPPCQPETWAERVVSLLNDPELRARMGQRGRKRAEQMFSIQAMIENMDQLYQNALK